MSATQIPAQDAKSYSDQEAERAWIAKYRLALESAASLKPVQSRGIRAAMRGLCVFLSRNLGRLLRSLPRPQPTDIKIPKRAVASAKIAEPQVDGVGAADAETAPTQRVS